MSATDVAARRGIRGKVGRIVGIDVARGIALITMAATHMLPVATPDGRLTTTAWLFAGRASALFALLAGVSLAIVTGGREPKSGRDLTRGRVIIAIRAGVIGLIGLLLALIETPVAVILAYYAVYFLLAIPFLRLRARTLALLAAAWALLSPQLSYVIRGSLPDPPYEQVNLVMLLTDPGTALPTLLFTGYYPAFTWMTFILAGLAVGRSNLRARSTGIALAVGGAVLAAGAWLTSAALLQVLGVSAAAQSETGQQTFVGWEVNHIHWYGTTPTDDPVWLLVAGPHSGTTFDLLGVTGSALAVLGVCLLLTRASVLRTVLYPLAAVGAMTLTLYTVHVVSLAFHESLFGERTYYVVQVLIALVVAPLWLWFFSKGPLEALVHTIATGLGRLAVPPEPEPAEVQGP